MEKDIKIGIIGTLISLFLFALGVFLITNENFNTFLQESSKGVKNMLALFVVFCFMIGFIASIIFIEIIIVLLFIKCRNKRVDKYNCKLREEIKSKLPKETEFSVNITNQNNEDLNEFLCKNLKCTALFDGSTVYIEFSLPEKVILKTDDILWFNDIFNY